MNNKMRSQNDLILKIVMIVVCSFLTVLCIVPFWIMICNSTRSTVQIQQHALSFLPSKYLLNNWRVYEGKDFNPMVGFGNSAIISCGVTVLSMYFSSLTAYALTAYAWKMRDAFFKVILAMMMIPGTVTMIGFYQAVYKLGLTNNPLMLIIPAIASPMTVFFLRQYLQGALSMEIVESARVDGAGEFYTFNKIVLPIMKPAIATQAIFTFVSSWNSYFTPMILLNEKSKYTMPIMIGLLRGDIYKTEYGSVYLGLTLTVLPLLVVYLLLSRYIVSGVALGSVKG